MTINIGDRLRIPPIIAKPLYSAFLGPGRAIPTWRLLRELEESQWLSPAEVKERQLQRLREVLDYAYEHTPYYRYICRNRGLRKGWLQSPEDLIRLPVLTRSELLANRAELVSDCAQPGAFINFSSGSTGQRAEFVQDRAFINFARALQFRGYGWCGEWRPGEPLALVWGSPVHKQFDGWRKQLARGLINRRQLDCYQLGEKQVSHMLDRLLAIQPVLISGYTTALYLIGQLARRRGAEFTRLRAIQPTAEPLPPAMRKRLEEDFGLPVLNKYGSRETNMIAHQNPDGEGMLIQAENVFLEFLRPDGSPCTPGEKGHIVVTTLNNLSMPLIRYRTGDVGSLLQTGYQGGRGLPLMSEVQGREHDMLTTPLGGAIHPQLFSNIFMRSEAIDWFQVIQDQPHALRIRVVVSSTWSDRRAQSLREQIHQMTGFPFDIDFEVLSELPVSKTGKQPLCIRNCELPAEWNATASEIADEQ
ncbi:MAG: phenylacetate--CoA ligase family protein [Methylobacter sp.]